MRLLTLLCLTVSLWAMTNIGEEQGFLQPEKKKVFRVSLKE